MSRSSLALGLALAFAAAGGACGSDYGSAPSGEDAGAQEGGLDDGGGLPDASSERDDFAQPIVDPGTPVTASQAAAIFGGALSPEAGPCLLDPPVGALVPKNWLPLRFRQTALQGENLFEIRLVVPNQKSPLVVYTANAAYTLDAATWAMVTSAAAGAGPVTLSIKSATIDGAGSKIAGPFRGAEGTLEISAAEARGKISYFASGVSPTVKQFRVGDTTVQPLTSAAENGVTCIGCHTVTPDGLYVASTLEGATGGIAIRPAGGGTTPPAFVSAAGLTSLARTNQFAAAFSKSHWQAGDRAMLSIIGDGNTAAVFFTDLETGASQPIVTGPGVAAHSVTWSNDGTKIAWISTASALSGTSSTDGNVMTMAWDHVSKTSGPPTALVGEGTTSSGPSFSADDTFVAFHRVPAATSTYNAASSEVWIVSSNGSAKPERLAANDPVACSGKSSPGVTNSRPRWSPEVLTLGAKKISFVAFSSTRFDDNRQIFVAPVVVEGTTVTTYPALYPYNQPADEGNHTPQWSLPL